MFIYPILPIEYARVLSWSSSSIDENLVDTIVNIQRKGKNKSEEKSKSHQQDYKYMFETLSESEIFHKRSVSYNENTCKNHEKKSFAKEEKFAILVSTSKEEYCERGNRPP